MAIDCILDDYSIFKENKKSLKEISVDTSKDSGCVYMTESQLQVIDFDKVKTVFTNERGHSEEDACSLDALYQHDEQFIFMEFKNGKVNNSNVRWKVYDSLMILGSIINFTINQLRSKGVLIVVYNQERNPLRDNGSKGNSTTDSPPSLVSIAKGIKNLAGEELIRFNLERFKDLYFDEVHTYTQPEFEAYLKTIM